jgi:hypothetical protein
MRAPTCLLLAFAAACGSSPHDAAPDAPPGVDASIDPIPLGSLMPQEIAGNASAVMATPTVVSITYDGDPNRTDTEAFYHQYAASPAWALQTAEYGIGPLTVGTPQHLTGAAATSDAAIRQILTSHLTGATPAWGAPSQNTLYSFTLPVGTSYTYGPSANYCGGYHDDVVIGGVDVAYSIQLPCTFPPPTTPLQVLTFTLSHELVEGVTDPRWEHDYAWGAVDDPHQVWSYVTDGEVADLCEYAETFLWKDAPGMTYTIQRIWSNAAARAGTDPCIGSPTTPYYQTVPDQPDDVTISLFGGSAATKGKKIALAATGMLTLHVAGTPGSGPFTVTAYDIASRYLGASTPALKLVQPTGTFEIGDTVTIPVTVMAKDASLGAESFEVDTKPVNGGPTTYFYGVIAQ